MPAARRIYKVRELTSVSTKGRRRKLPQLTIQSIAGQSTTRRLRLSISCPRAGTLIEPTTSFSFRQYNSVASPRSLQRFSSLHQMNSSHREVFKRNYGSCNAGCPCPFPCGPCGSKAGCGCLPPPCNTPPKCLQYMTGYYYYPYGTWFCGPYHVSGTCAPVGANGPCPCPCPPKCCPACVCAPQYTKNMCSNKNVSDTNQFPMELPCHTVPKSTQEVRTGFSKMFNFSSPAADKKDSQQKQKPTGLPPVLSSMFCPNSLETSFMDKEPRIKSTLDSISRTRFYHTKTNKMPEDLSYKAPTTHTQRNWKYSYYQTRHNLATPTGKARLYLKESRNVSSISNKKKHSPRPDIDVEIKAYDD
ncbi:jg11412 [Pararge aegeria aegeria]|uniref:Jg11412 protein n=2 Tax=Pararge aegeria TaxID=116150 RepID=A0A8S4QSZ5_9NEOP|nr:jg11412 [Pararge aegeria aegeria]